MQGEQDAVIHRLCAAGVSLSPKECEKWGSQGAPVGYAWAHEGVKLLEHWRPRIRDLNPIEILWAILARRVSDCGRKDREELCTFITQVWEAIPQAEIDHLVLGFQSRRDFCFMNNGR